MHPTKAVKESKKTAAKPVEKRLDRDFGSIGLIKILLTQIQRWEQADEGIPAFFVVCILPPFIEEK
ncbi:hypothetical protein GGP53_003133 [Salinibacter ruber]|uniref:hypothetical protein n=1 Tax=Salinibacter ruber TaxID=146919 RepID=UPI0021675B3F|nr:hypothetical protein [Salinibacter ruber]MCS3629253.1 hypothetical protein [Salinibacter ruber]MCS4146161.1 hypothetical protein [Salinibacter ruber]